MNRHADPITLDHIIDLRKRVAFLEKQLENTLSWVTPLRRENERLLEAVRQVGFGPLRRENERLLEAVRQVGFGMVPIKEEGKPYREDR